MFWAEPVSLNDVWRSQNDELYMLQRLIPYPQSFNSVVSHDIRSACKAIPASCLFKKNLDGEHIFQRAFNDHNKNSACFIQRKFKQNTKYAIMLLWEPLNAKRFQKVRTQIERNRLYQLTFYSWKLSGGLYNKNM